MPCNSVTQESCIMRGSNGGSAAHFAPDPPSRSIQPCYLNSKAIILLPTLQRQHTIWVKMFISLSIEAPSHWRGKKQNICKCCCKFFDGCLLWPTTGSQRPRLLLLLQLAGSFHSGFFTLQTQSYPAPHRTKVDELVDCFNEWLTGSQCFLNRDHD